MVYKQFDGNNLEQIKELFGQEGWVAYLNDDEKLICALKNSLYLLGAFEEENLVGFVRCVGDGAHIVVMQDLLVKKEYRQRGIGTYLLKDVMEKYSNVRAVYITTDVENKTAINLYKKLGLEEFSKGNLISFFR